MNTIFDVISDPTRRRILDLLRQRPYLVGELTQILGISQPGVSKQLRILREAGLVNVKIDKQRRWYTLQPEPLQEVDQWLAGYRSLWSGRFKQLDDLLSDLEQEESTNDGE